MSEPTCQREGCTEPKAPRRFKYCSEECARIAHQLQGWTVGTTKAGRQRRKAEGRKLNVERIETKLDRLLENDMFDFTVVTDGIAAFVVAIVGLLQSFIDGLGTFLGGFVG